MTKKEIVKAISGETGVTQEAIEKVIDSYLQLAITELENDRKFIFAGIGIIGVRVAKERVGRNPRTGEKIAIPKRKKLHFVVSKKWKNFGQSV